MFEKISPSVLQQIDVLDELQTTWEGEGYYRFVYSDGPRTAPVWYEKRSDLLSDYISELETDATDIHLPSIDYVGFDQLETVPASNWDVFCHDSDVRTNLIGILQHYVEDWVNNYSRVRGGIDTSYVAKQRCYAEAAQVLGAANMVSAITGDAPGALVFEVSGLRDCILYVSKYK